jgi:hypothetical protein
MKGRVVLSHRFVILCTIITGKIVSLLIHTIQYSRLVSITFFIRNLGFNDRSHQESNLPQSNRR